MRTEKSPQSKQPGDQPEHFQGCNRTRCWWETSWWEEGEVVKVIHVDKSCPKLCLDSLMVTKVVCGKSAIYLLWNDVVRLLMRLRQS